MAEPRHKQGPAIPPPMSEAPQNLEATFIDVFAELADLFGNPRSHGQVYGVLFGSTVPLTQETIAERLQISAASVSLALRALEGFGAVEKIPAPAVRTQATYTAHTVLRPLVLGFVQNRLLPKLNASNEKLGLASQLPKLTDPDSTELQIRLERVVNWHKHATRLLSGADQILRLISRN